MVDEANVAFRLNMELFQELDATAGFTSENEEQVEEKPATPHDGHPTTEGNTAKCPFHAMMGMAGFKSSTPPPDHTPTLSQSQESTPSPVSLRNSGSGARSITKEGADSEAAAPSFAVAGLIAAFCFALSFFIVQYSGASYL